MVLCSLHSRRSAVQRYRAKAPTACGPPSSLWYVRFHSRWFTSAATQASLHSRRSAVQHYRAKASTACGPPSSLWYGRFHSRWFTPAFVSSPSAAHKLSSTTLERVAVSLRNHGRQHSGIHHFLATASRPRTLAPFDAQSWSRVTCTFVGVSS